MLRPHGCNAILANRTIPKVRAQVRGTFYSGNWNDCLPTSSSPWRPKRLVAASSSVVTGLTEKSALAARRPMRWDHQHRLSQGNCLRLACSADNAWLARQPARSNCLPGTARPWCDLFCVGPLTQGKKQRGAVAPLSYQTELGLRPRTTIHSRRCCWHSGS